MPAAACTMARRRRLRRISRMLDRTTRSYSRRTAIRLAIQRRPRPAIRRSPATPRLRISMPTRQSPSGRLRCPFILLTLRRCPLLRTAPRRQTRHTLRVSTRSRHCRLRTIKRSISKHTQRERQPARPPPARTSTRRNQGHSPRHLRSSHTPGLSRIRCLIPFRRFISSTARRRRRRSKRGCLRLRREAPTRFSLRRQLPAVSHLTLQLWSDALSVRPAPPSLSLRITAQQCLSSCRSSFILGSCSMSPGSSLSSPRQCHRISIS